MKKKCYIPQNLEIKMIFFNENTTIHIGNLITFSIQSPKLNTFYIQFIELKTQEKKQVDCLKINGILFSK